MVNEFLYGDPVKLEALLDLLRSKGVSSFRFAAFAVEFAPPSVMSPDNATDAERDAWRQRLESEEGQDNGEVRMPRGPLSDPGLFPGGVPIIPNYETGEGD